MFTTLQRRRRRGTHIRLPGRPWLEPLEVRTLLDATTAAPLVPLQVEKEPNDTLDLAQDVGTLNGTQPMHVQGAIGNSPTGAADVDWYQFEIATSSRVTLTTQNAEGAGPVTTVLSLYNNDPFDFGDPYSRLGHRLIAQNDGTGYNDVAAIERSLAPGTYFVAVSGQGNRYFHPFLSDSGLPGKTGPYDLTLSATDLGLDPNAGPLFLSADPPPRASLLQAPLVLRVQLTSAIDPATINTDPEVGDVTVKLLYNPSSPFGVGHDSSADVVVALSSVNSSMAVRELQVTPSAPLARGFYQLFLAGDTDPGFMVLMDLNGIPLGTDADHPAGQDLVLPFRVTGNEGNTSSQAGPDDTASTAHELGTITHAGTVQVAGVIGDDATAPRGSNPAADVDLYHFRITDPGQFAFAAEVFAGRIGSPLNPGISLFRLDPLDGQLHLVAGNDDTLNDQPASNRKSVPLRADSALYVGLTAGEYYVAVSAHNNVPDPLRNLLPGQKLPTGKRIFDPNRSHSGTAGTTTGDYVLNLFVQQDSVPPWVMSTSLAEHGVLPAPPTSLTVHFSKPVNAQQLAYEATLLLSQSQVRAVFFQAADGTQYYPRFISFDPSTNVATFQCLDALPNGPYTLHLSGARGLQDFAGNPLVGNDPSGDYVVHFEVDGPARGSDLSPRAWNYADLGPAAVHEQTLGVLFPRELQAGVTVQRNLSAGTDALRTERTDDYSFTVLQSQSYDFTVNGPTLPAGVSLSLVDADGNPVASSTHESGLALNAFLQPGTYDIRIQGWSTSQAPNIAYVLRLTLEGSADAPTPLSNGPAPAIRLRLVSNDSPPPPSPPPGLVVQLSPTPSTDVGGGVQTVQVSIASSSGVSPAVTLPSGLLLALSSSPRATASGPDNSGSAATVERVALHLPDAPVPEGLLRLAILTQPGLSSGSDNPANPEVRKAANPAFTYLARMVGEQIPNLAKPVEQALDILFSQWWEHLPVPDVAPDRLEEEELPAEEADPPRSEVRSADSPAELEPLALEQTSGSSDRAWAAALGAVGLAFLVDSRKTGKLPVALNRS
jgi:hypothetical protein